MELSFFEGLTIFNSIMLAILPLVFFRRQKLQEIRYKELMELNIKTHDITKRADTSVSETSRINKNDYLRLDYLISRFKKHNKKLSNKIQAYKDKWSQVIELQNIDKEKIIEIKKDLLKMSEEIRNLADKLLK